MLHLSIAPFFLMSILLKGCTTEIYQFIYTFIYQYTFFFECLTGLHKADKNDYIGNFMWAKVFISLGYLGIELLG